MARPDPAVDGDRSSVKHGPHGLLARRHHQRRQPARQHGRPGRRHRRDRRRVPRRQLRRAAGRPPRPCCSRRSLAALGGFLVYNFNPASIFMGDCGSLFIGFFLAGVRAGQHAGAAARATSSSVLAVPVLLLLHPDLRHHARHGPAQAVRPGGLAGRARPHVAPAGRARPVRAARGLACCTGSPWPRACSHCRPQPAARHQPGCHRPGFTVAADVPRRPPGRRQGLRG